MNWRPPLGYRSLRYSRGLLAYIAPLVLVLLMGGSLLPNDVDSPDPPAPSEPLVSTGSANSSERKPITSNHDMNEACPECFVLLEELARPPAPETSNGQAHEPEPPPPPLSPPFAVPARAVAILEAPCGELVYGKDEHAALPPASLTKIVTALAAIDRIQLSDIVQVDVSGSELKRRTRSSIMGLEPGLRVTVEDLLYGLFLPSGNDAAIELAEHVSGDVRGFVELMNQKAAELGMADSHFGNPHGLDAHDLRSSAFDMATAGLALMQNDTLAWISGAPSYTLDGGLHLTNGNRLLQLYPGAFGVKIGYTRAAGHTIVGAASRDGRDLYISVFGSNNLYPETIALLDWAFAETPSACAP